MKKLILILLAGLIVLPVMSQKFEMDLRLGVNMQTSSSPDNTVSFLPHFGAMSGIRFSTIGIYAEMLLSFHDYDDWAEQGTYLVPSLLVRYYGFRFIYLEGGPSYYLLAEKQVAGAAVPFPDKKFGFFGGAGFYVGRFDIGLRATTRVKSIQATVTYIF